MDSKAIHLDDSILENNLNDSITYDEFFKAFGYGINEDVYIRLFDDSKLNPDDHGSKRSIERGLLTNMIKSLRAENAKRRGVYFIVNGGGNTDKEVIKSGCCKAQFMEIDNLPFSDQIEAINSFPLEPSIIIKTKKSLHCYWLLNNGDISQFRGIQERLAQYFNSDTTICNESRVLRLYGFNHCKQEPPTMVKLIKFSPDIRYTQEEMSEVLPEFERTAAGATSAISYTRTAAIFVNSEGLVPHGQRYKYIVSRIGTFINRLGDIVDDGTLLAMAEYELFNHCSSPDDVDLEEFRRKCMYTIATFRARKAASDRCDEYLKGRQGNAE